MSRQVYLFALYIFFHFVSLVTLHPFGPGDVPAHRLIRAGVIATTETLRDFAWHMQRKHATMQPAEHQPGSATLPSSAILVQPTRALDTVGWQPLTSLNRRFEMRKLRCISSYFVPSSIRISRSGRGRTCLRPTAWATASNISPRLSGSSSTIS